MRIEFRGFTKGCVQVSLKEGRGSLAQILELVRCARTKVGLGFCTYLGLAVPEIMSDALAKYHN